MRHVALIFFLVLPGCLFTGQDPEDIDAGALRDEGMSDARSGGDVDRSDAIATHDMGSSDVDVIPDMPIGPIASLVVTHKTDEIDTDGCTTEHCTLREAVAAARERAALGEYPEITFEFVEEPDDTVLGVRIYQIPLQETLRLDVPMRIAGPDRNAELIYVVPVDTFVDGPLIEVASDVEWRVANLVGSPQYAVVAVTSGDVVFEDINLFGGSLGLRVTGGHVRGDRLGIGAPRLAARPDGLSGNGIGIAVLGDAGLTLTDSTIAGNTGHGVYVGPGIPAVTIEDSLVGLQSGGGTDYPNGGHGVVVLRQAVSVLGSSIGNNAMSGITVDIDPQTSGVTTIAGNTIVENLHHGIDVLSADDLRVGEPTRGSGCLAAQGCNTIVRNAGVGVRVLGTRQVDIYGNHVGFDTGPTGGNGQGIVVASPATVLAADGSPCRYGADCTSGVCRPESIAQAANLGGECVASCPDGEACNVDAHPASGSIAIGPRTEPGAVGTCEGPCNLVANNTGAGITVGAAPQVTVFGNYVGVIRSGLGPASNQTGIVVSTDDARIAGNLVSGNSRAGIVGTGRAITVANNYVGVNRDGLEGAGTLGNVGNGIELASRDGGIIGNTVAGNEGGGVWLDPAVEFTGLIEANRIGTSADGLMRIPNAGGHGIEIPWCNGCEVLSNRIVGLDRGDGLHLGTATTMFTGTVRANRVGELANGDPAGWGTHGILGVAVDGSSFEGNFIANTFDDPSSTSLGSGLRFIRGVDVRVTDNEFLANHVGIDALGATGLVMAVWDHNRFSNVFNSVKSIRLATNPNDASDGDSDTGPNHLIDSPMWAANPTLLSGEYVATFNRPIAGARIELLASDGDQTAAEHLDFCVETGLSADPGRQIQCRGNNWNVRSGVIAIQSARRVVFRFSNTAAGSVDITLPGSTTQTLFVPAGMPAARAAALTTALTALPGSAYVVASTPQCPGTPSNQCVDVMLPFDAIVANENRIDLEQGQISSELSAYRALP